MDEILELQRRLATAQSSVVASRLSERNCIELVMKLQSLSLVDLIFTRTGREYLTPARLRREIQDEIFVRGGRVNVLELPDALNVDLSHVHAALPDVLHDAPCRTRVVNGEVVTEEYLATLAADVDLALAQSATGLDSVGDIATRTNLPVDIVRDCVRTHIGTIIRATLDEATGAIRSHAARNRALIAARGALRGVATPSKLVDMCSRHDIPADIMVSACTDLLANGSIRGRVDGHGARAIFIPAVFEIAARSAAISSFANAGFLTTDKLRTTFISNPDSFATISLPDAVNLGSVIIGQSVIEAVQSSGVEAISNGSWLDIAGALPADFPPSAIPRVVDILEHSGKNSNRNTSKTHAGVRGSKGTKRKGEKPSTYRPGDSNQDTTNAAMANLIKLNAPVLQSQFLVSEALLQSCSACVKRDAVKRAKSRAKQVADILTVVGSTSAGVGDDKKFENEDVGDGKNTNKAKGRRRKERNVSGNRDGDIQGTQRRVLPITVPSTDDIFNLLSMDDELGNVFTTDYIGNTPSDISELLRAIVETIFDASDGIASLYEAEASAAVAEMEKARAAANLALAKQIITDLELAELYDLNADALSLVTDDLPATSRKYVVDTTCLGATLKILDLIASNMGVAGSGIGGPADKNLMCDAVKSISKRLPPDVASKVRRLVGSVTGKSADSIKAFLEAYDESAETLDMPERRPLDKKKERALNAILCSQYAQVLSDDNADLPRMTTIDALRMAVTFLYAKTCNGALIPIAPTSVLAVCSWIELHANSEGLATALGEFRSAIMCGLRAQNDDESCPKSPVMDDQKMLDCLAQLRQNFTPV
jgi:E3 UFM1-protein ligase 1